MKNKPLLIVESPTKVKTIQQYLGKDYDVISCVGHVKDLPRNEVLSKFIKNVLLIKTRSIKEQIKLINDCAPEHLILLDNNFSSFIPEVSNAGSIFCGPLTPVSFGDYASGTNHVLPTNGMAKTRSGLGLIDFGKVISSVEFIPM